MLPSSCSLEPHDHAHCASNVLSHADQLKAEQGLRMTPVRRAALEILLSEQKAMGAYDVLEKLAEQGFGSQPPVAYRALDFLVDNGLAHRVRRLNAFAACTRPTTIHSPVFLICRECDAVAEAASESVQSALIQAAANEGFQIERTNVEVLGLCPTCQAAA